jgi:hypothetical protein
MAPATRKAARKKGAAMAEKDAAKALAQKISVDGDGCWDVESNEARDCFEFAGLKGYIFVQSETVLTPAAVWALHLEPYSAPRLPQPHRAQIRLLPGRLCPN